MATNFDSFLAEGQDGSEHGPQRPFWSVDLKSDKEVLKWLEAEYAFLKNEAHSRHETQKKNLLVYRGIQYQNQNPRSRDEDADTGGLSRRSRNPKLVYNHTVDMVEQHVSRLTKYRAAITAEPATEDHQDRVVARISEDLITGYWDKIDIDKVMQDHHRRKRIMGEDYLFVLWNPQLGTYHPDWLRECFQLNGIKEDPSQMSAGEIREVMRTRVKETPRIELRDPETGEPITGEDGQVLTIDQPVRLGDVEYRPWLSWNVFLQRKDSFSEVEYIFAREYKFAEDLKADHPKHADKIKKENESSYFDPNTCEDVSRKGLTEVIHFWHRSTDQLDQGRYCKFVGGVLLVNKPNPYVGYDDKAILPCVRTVDIETPGVLNGDATVTYSRACQIVYNNIVSMRIRNLFNFAHPKWAVPAGSVEVAALSNGSTMMQYKGPVAPQVMQPQLASAELTAMQQEAKNDMQQISQVFGTSRGEVPAGMTAGVALIHMDEQENELANVAIQNHTRTLKNMAQQTAWIMSDQYQDAEGRLESLLGKTKAQQAKHFRMANLRSVSDFGCSTGSALPHQRGARIQALLDIGKERPGVVSDEMFIDVTGLGETKRFQNAVTVALQKAESENDALFNGGEPRAPEEGENHLQHYRVHIRGINEEAFNDLPDEQKVRFEDHVMATEMLMWEAGKRNPQYIAMIMAEFPTFPVFYVPDMPALPAVAGDPAMGGLPPAAMPVAPAMPAELPPEAIPAGIESMIPPEQGLAPGVETLDQGGIQ